MGSIYTRGRILWIRYKDANGKWTQASTKLGIHERAKALKALAALEAKIAAGVPYQEATLGPVTVGRYAAKWLKNRANRKIRCAKDDATRLRLHVLPVIGNLELGQVSPRHIRDLVRTLKAAGEVAPRTIRHVYGIVRTMFHDAEVDELIAQNPCKLKRGDLPQKVDKDPNWRATAVLTREEVESLISASVLSQESRTTYALMAFTGMRFGEISALRWRAYRRDEQPLGKLLVAKSFDSKERAEKSLKTERPREVPVHPELRRILDQWWATGWEEMMGYEPSPEDLIMPKPNGANRTNKYGWKRWTRDLKALGLPHRRQHDSRRTFVSLALADGARKDVLRWVSHGPSGDIVDQYTTLPWATLCEEVAKLKLCFREAVPLRSNRRHLGRTGAIALRVPVLRRRKTRHTPP